MPNTSAAPIDPALRARLDKLLALARQGVGGERDNAGRFLERALAEHGLTRADLDAPAHAPKRRVWLAYRSKEERTLALHLGAGIAGTYTAAGVARAYVPRGKRRVGFDCTPAQAAELAVAWEVYRRAWADAAALALHAFQTRHDIGVRARGDDEPDFTPEERARLRRVADLADALPDVARHRRLGAPA